MARIRSRHREKKGIGFFPPVMTQSRSNLEEILETQIQTLALTLQPGTVRGYRSVVRGSAASLNCAAIPISLAGSAGYAKSNRPSATDFASIACFAYPAEPAKD